MTKHKSILTDAEMHTLISGNPFTLGLSIARLKDFIRQVEKAVQAKLVEQHTPIAWLNEETGDVISSELKDDAPEMLKGYDVPLYKCPDFSCQGLLDSSNAPFTPKNASEMRSFIGMNFDSLQYANPETEEPHEMDRYSLTIHDLLSAFDWAGHYDCDHIADASKMVTPDGWQLVPIEPTDEMLVSGQEEWALGKRGAMEDCEESKAIFKAMLAAAPKYKWSKE